MSAFVGFVGTSEDVLSICCMCHNAARVHKNG